METTVKTWSERFDYFGGRDEGEVKERSGGTSRRKMIYERLELLRNESVTRVKTIYLKKANLGADQTDLVKSACFIYPQKLPGSAN